MIISPSYQAFTALFQAQYNDLCNYAYRFLKNDAAAEDVVQETFIKLWQKHQHLTGIPNIKAYLFRAVRNNAISVLRRLHLETVGNKDFEWITADAERPDELELHYAKPYYKQLIYEAIANLPPQCREVFTCCRLQGMTHQQTALKLKLSPKTVENYMGRALKCLRKYLQRYDLPVMALFFIKLLQLH